MSDTPLRTWLDARILRLQGPGAAEFMQGYCTCDTQALKAGDWVPMAICNLKGRVLASGWLVGLPDLGIVIHHSLAENIAAFLAPYLQFARCELDTVTYTPQLRADADLHTPGEHETVAAAEVAQLIDVEQSLLGQPDAIPGEDVSPWMNRRLIESGFAFIDDQTTGQFLPQMLALDKQGAVDFNKGCYLGQEIVARAQFRGAVKRQLHPFSWQDAPATPGEENDEGQIVISVTSHAPGVGLAVG